MAERRPENTFPAPPETHLGIVTCMEDDYSTVRLRNPDGLEYSKNFETPFLQSVGIRTGDTVKIVFEERVEGREAIVTMRVSKKETTPETPQPAGEESNPWGDERLASMRPH